MSLPASVVAAVPTSPPASGGAKTVIAAAKDAKLPSPSYVPSRLRLRWVKRMTFSFSAQSAAEPPPGARGRAVSSSSMLKGHTSRSCDYTRGAGAGRAGHARVGRCSFLMSADAVSRIDLSVFFVTLLPPALHQHLNPDRAPYDLAVDLPVRFIQF